MLSDVAPPLRVFTVSAFNFLIALATRLALRAPGAGPTALQRKLRRARPRFNNGTFGGDEPAGGSRGISPRPVEAATHQERRSLRNFSRNRPEVTNRNHQYAIRRVLIECNPCSGRALIGCEIARPMAHACDLLHIRPWKHGGGSHQGRAAMSQFRCTVPDGLATIEASKSSDDEFRKRRRRCRKQ